MTQLREDKSRFTLRLPQRILDAIQHQAQQLGLSKNAYLIMLILKDLEQNKSA